jgi:outer membrane receptor protein involved in Fe transport
LIPLVGPEQLIPLVSRLDLSIAGRVERYTDFGTTGNPRLGVTWRPYPSLALRGTFGTSFRAPSFIDIRQGPGLSQIVPFPLADPASPNGFSRVVALFGNRPDIGPERARTWTAGFDVTPSFVQGLTLSATYFDIAYRGRITNVAGEFFSFLSQRERFASLILDDPSSAVVAALYADPTFINPFGIAAASVTAIIDARNANLARTKQRGIDFDVGYRQGSTDRSFEIGVSGSYLFTLKEQVTATAPETEVVSTIGNPVDLRVRGRGSAVLGPLSLAAFANYVDGYRNIAVSPAERVRSWTTVDVQIGYKLSAARGPFSGTRAVLSLTNLFDRAPPYVNNRTPFSASGFDPENASPVGRLIALQLVKSW